MKHKQCANIRRHKPDRTNILSTATQLLLVAHSHLNNHTHTVCLLQTIKDAWEFSIEAVLFSNSDKSKSRANDDDYVCQIIDNDDSSGTC